MRVKLVAVLSRMTLKIDKWHWKTIEHLFYTTSSFAPHLESIDEVKLKVTVWKGSILVKIDEFFVPRSLEISWMTLKTIGHLFCTTLSFVQHLKAIGIFKLEL